MGKDKIKPGEPDAKTAGIRLFAADAGIEGR